MTFNDRLEPSKSTNQMNCTAGYFTFTKKSDICNPETQILR